MTQKDLNHSNTFDKNFPFESIKVTEEFSELLEKLAFVLLFHQKIDCFVLKRHVDML